MTFWSKAAVKTVLVPGGIILAVAALFAQYSWVPPATSGMTFFYYAVFVAALALSLRFRSLRIVFASIVLLLAHYALSAKGSSLQSAPGRMAFEAVALLVPLDFILLTFLPERTLRREHFIGVAAALFFQRQCGSGAKCLILENHPIFGGEAKQNEFLVDGKRLIAHQGSAIYQLQYPHSFLARFYDSIGLKTPKLTYQKWGGPQAEMSLSRTPYEAAGLRGSPAPVDHAGGDPRRER